MEINRAKDLDETITDNIKDLKKLTARLEALAKVFRNQADQKVKSEWANYVEELETVHFNAQQILQGNIFR